MAKIMRSVFKPILPPFRKFKKEIYLKHSETCQFIYQLGEKTVIRQKSKEVSVNEITTELFQQKLKYLKSCLLKYRKITGQGRGIAAIQIGIPERFAVVFRIKNQPLVIINPHITKVSKKLLKFPEGCMSCGPLYAKVTRSSWIEFSYLDESGKKQFWNTKDTDQDGKIYNRIFQHEIDHMDGVVCLDKVAGVDILLESDPTFYQNAEFEEVQP